MNNILCLMLSGTDYNRSGLTEHFGKYSWRQFGENIWFVKTNVSAQDFISQIRPQVQGAQVVITRVDANGIYPDEIQTFLRSSQAA